MRFTLKLNDYLEQYVINCDKEAYHCPICYDQCLTFNHVSDIEHILLCYKVHLMELELENFHRDYGEYPQITEDFIYTIMDSVSREMERYYTRYKT